MDEQIDRTIIRDPAGRHSYRLYTAARKNGEGSLVGLAADQLLAADVSSGSVAIATGFPIPPNNRPETDGPVGAAVLARAIERLGGRPVFVVDARTEPVVSAVAASAGVEHVKTVSPAAARTWLEGGRFAAIVTIETPGVTADGSYRTMTGDDITAAVDPVDGLVDQAVARAVPTIAIGDGGNEVGMGAIRSAVETHIEFGKTIACVTAVDTLVVAGVSNWGAYGIVAALSNRTGRQLLHTPIEEQRLLDVAVDTGAVDGVSGASTATVDGIGVDQHKRVVNALAAQCDRASQ